MNGVVLAAVAEFDRAVAEMDETEFAGILSVKIDVAVRALQVFRRETLDFVLFFSSISSFIKNGGMSGYSAGCTFQDAYAALLRRELGLLGGRYRARHPGDFQEPDGRSRRAAVDGTSGHGRA